jgi:hypothetical protein
LTKIKGETQTEQTGKSNPLSPILQLLTDFLPQLKLQIYKHISNGNDKPKNESI